MRLLFKGGTVITGRAPRRADILVEGEKILTSAATFRPSVRRWWMCPGCCCSPASSTRTPTLI